MNVTVTSGNNMVAAEFTEFPHNCGMAIVHGFNSRGTVSAKMLRSLHQEVKESMIADKARVFVSDRKGGLAQRFAEANKYKRAGGFTKNPSTGNMIASWYFTQTKAMERAAEEN